MHISLYIYIYITYIYIYIYTHDYLSFELSPASPLAACRDDIGRRAARRCRYCAAKCSTRITAVNIARVINCPSP